MGRSWWQFSVKSLILLTAFCASLIALWVLNRRLSEAHTEHARFRAKAEAEIDRYRAELGELKISDPARVHAVRIPFPSLDDGWRWRVYVPDGRLLSLYADVGDIPENEYSSTNSGIHRLQPGEYVVVAGVGRDLSGNPKFMVKTAGGASKSLDLDARQIDWLDWRSRVSTESGVLTTETQSAEPGKPLVLLCMRVEDKAGDGTPVGSEGHSAITTREIIIRIDDPSEARAKLPQSQTR